MIGGDAHVSGDALSNCRIKRPRTRGMGKMNLLIVTGLLLQNFQGIKGRDYLSLNLNTPSIIDPRKELIGMERDPMHFTAEPSVSPTYSPTFFPSTSPTQMPSFYPSTSPSVSPSTSPSHNPTQSLAPSLNPSLSPSDLPTLFPSNVPSAHPTTIYPLGYVPNASLPEAEGYFNYNPYDPLFGPGRPTEKTHVWNTTVLENVTIYELINVTNFVIENVTSIVKENVTRVVKENITSIITENVTYVVKENATRIVHESITVLGENNTSVTTLVNNTVVEEVNKTVVEEVNKTVTEEVNQTVVEEVNRTITEEVNRTITEEVNATITQEVNKTYTHSFNYLEYQGNAWESVQNNQEFLYWKNDINQDMKRSLRNKCQSRPESSQSPIDLCENHVNTQCLEHHQIRNRGGDYSFEDEEVQIQVHPSKLRIEYSRVNADLDPTFPKPPHGDFAHHWNGYFSAVHIDVKIPSEHTVCGKHYAGEYQIYFYHPGRKLPIVQSVLIDIHHKNRINTHFQKVINEWQAVYDKNRADCMNYTKSSQVEEEQFVRRMKNFIGAEVNDDEFSLWEDRPDYEESGSWASSHILDEPVEEERKFQNFVTMARQRASQPIFNDEYDSLVYGSNNRDWAAASKSSNLIRDLEELDTGASSEISRNTGVGNVNTEVSNLCEDTSEMFMMDGQNRSCDYLLSNDWGCNVEGIVAMCPKTCDACSHCIDSNETFLMADTNRTCNDLYLDNLKWGCKQNRLIKLCPKACLPECSEGDAIVSSSGLGQPTLNPGPTFLSNKPSLQPSMISTSKPSSRPSLGWSQSEPPILSESPLSSSLPSLQPSMSYSSSQPSLQPSMNPSSSSEPTSSPKPSTSPSSPSEQPSMSHSSSKPSLQSSMNPSSSSEPTSSTKPSMNPSSSSEPTFSPKPSTSPTSPSEPTFSPRPSSAPTPKPWNPFHPKIIRSLWFYGYYGSLTEPPCSEWVSWRVLDVPMLISIEQWEQMRNILFNQVDGSCKKTSAHWHGSVARPTQSLGDRHLWKCTKNDYVSDWEKAKIREETGNPDWCC